MTHDRPVKEPLTIWKIVSNLLLALVAATATHLLDVVAVKDRVENIRTEQIENSKERILSQTRWKQYLETDLPALLLGQRKMNERLCRVMAANNIVDRECGTDTWLELRPHKRQK